MAWLQPSRVLRWNDAYTTNGSGPLAADTAWSRLDTAPPSL